MSERPRDTGRQLTGHGVAWHAVDADVALDRLGTSARGLASAEAEHRLREWGPNQLRVTPPRSG